MSSWDRLTVTGRDSFATRFAFEQNERFLVCVLCGSSIAGASGPVIATVMGVDCLLRAWIPAYLPKPTLGQLLWEKPAARVRVLVFVLVLAGGIGLITAFAYFVSKRRTSGAAARQHVPADFISVFVGCILAMLFVFVIGLPLAWAQDAWYYVRPEPPPYVVSQ
jgi:hypothetical protein